MYYSYMFFVRLFIAFQLSNIPQILPLKRYQSEFISIINSRVKSFYYHCYSNIKKKEIFFFFVEDYIYLLSDLRETEGKEFHVSLICQSGVYYYPPFQYPVVQGPGPRCHFRFQFVSFCLRGGMRKKSLFQTSCRISKRYPLLQIAKVVINFARSWQRTNCQRRIYRVFQLNSKQ